MEKMALKWTFDVGERGVNGRVVGMLVCMRQPKGPASGLVRGVWVVVVVSVLVACVCVFTCCSLGAIRRAWADRLLYASLFAKIWASEARVSCPRGDGEVVLIFLGECSSALLPHAERSIFYSIVGACCGEKVSSIAAKCWRG